MAAAGLTWVVSCVHQGGVRHYLEFDLLAVHLK